MDPPLEPSIHDGPEENEPHGMDHHIDVDVRNNLNPKI
jgi:hypothetical protein